MSTHCSHLSYDQEWLCNIGARRHSGFTKIPTEQSIIQRTFVITKRCNAQPDFECSDIIILLPWMFTHSSHLSWNQEWLCTIVASRHSGFTKHFIIQRSFFIIKNGATPGLISNVVTSLCSYIDCSNIPAILAEIKSGFLPLALNHSGITKIPTKQTIIQRIFLWIQNGAAPSLILNVVTSSCCYI